ncbi:MAG: penicillin acylase family protein, partial [Bacteroidota bacterium]
MKKILSAALLILLLIVVVAVLWIQNANNFKQDGIFDISINEQPIKIVRDANGIAYVIAENKADAIRGQGFVVAQDRLFQIEFYRALIRGELASLVGPSMVDSDIKMRVLNLAGNAKKSYTYLDKETKEFIGWYVAGFNEYLKVGTDEFPLELSLLGMTPQPMTPEEVVAVTHFIGLFHSQNMDDEILSLNLSAQTAFAKELLPLNVNLDRTQPLAVTNDSLPFNPSTKRDLSWVEPESPLLPYLKLGSNNWAIAGQKSTTGQPILSNDPHIDARMLPGNFYPIGLICPEFNAVGITAPGIPGLLVGRNDNVAFGVTNAYGDSQDLFIEEADGDYVRQNGKQVALQKRKEVIPVKGGEAVEITIRTAPRGPIISDFPVFGILTKDLVSLRWSLAETQSKGIGFERMLEAKNVEAFQKALTRMDNMFFNFILADVGGNIAHQSTGLVPIRYQQRGAVPQLAKADSSWLGFIPKDELPNTTNPARGWVGTANHDTRPDDYPYYYSSHFSPFYRYKRLKEVMAQDKKWDADSMWELIFDCKNMQAEQLTPLFIAALEQRESTRELADLLKDWNYHEEVD